LIERDRLAQAQQLLEENSFTGSLPDSTPYRLLLYSRGLLRLADGSPAVKGQSKCGSPANPVMIGQPEPAPRGVVRGQFGPRMRARSKGSLARP